MMVTVVDGTLSPPTLGTSWGTLSTMTPALYSESGCPRCHKIGPVMSWSEVIRTKEHVHDLCRCVPGRAARLRRPAPKTDQQGHTQADVVERRRAASLLYQATLRRF
jgi:hypothetical protein